MDDFFVSRPDIDEHLKDFTQSGTSLMLITGVGGSGKTTILRSYFDQHLKEKSFENGIYISGFKIRSVDDLELLILKEFDSNKWSNVTTKINEEVREILLAIIRTHKMLLIFDGLDEVPTENQRQVLDYLIFINDQFANGSKLIVSSRKYAENLVKSRSVHCMYLTIAPLSHKELIEAKIKQLRRTSPRNEEFYKIYKSLLGNSKDLPPAILELMLKLNDDDRVVLESFHSNSFSPSDLIEKLLSNLWSKLSEGAKQFVRALLIFEGSVTIEKLSLLVDINDEEFLDCINELKKYAVISISGNVVTFIHKTICEGLLKLLEQDHEGLDNTLDIYIDLNYVDKEQVVDLLKVLNDVYKSIGGDELTITESGINRFSHCPIKVQV
jgi:hypothetical protein